MAASCDAQSTDGHMTTGWESDKECIDLFLVGKTGHGKSSTGNTILQREAFGVSDLMQSKTKTSNVACIEKDGLMIRVVDTPGMSDTGISNAERTELEINNIAAAFQHCPNGFSALLLVYKYGNRFTREEKEIIEFLKKVLGTNFIKDHCILVITHGEDFDLQAKRTTGMTFDKWCESQTGALHDLIQECQNRVVLFRNCRPEDRAQVDKLLSLTKDTLRYTHQSFDQWKLSRQSLIEETAAFQLKERIEPKIRLLIESLDRSTSGKMSDEDVLKELTEVKKEALKLESEILEKGKESQILKTLHAYVKNLLATVEDHETLIKAKEEEERAQKKRRELERAEAKVRALEQDSLRVTSERKATHSRQHTQANWQESGAQHLPGIATPHSDRSSRTFYEQGNRFLDPATGNVRNQYIEAVEVFVNFYTRIRQQEREAERKSKWYHCNYL